MDDEERDRKKFDAFLTDVADAGSNVFGGAPALALVVMVDENGNYVINTNGFLTTSPVIYQAIGLLEQMKLDLLASVPRNRPLREPDADEDEETGVEPLPKPDLPS